MEIRRTSVRDAIRRKSGGTVGVQGGREGREGGRGGRECVRSWERKVNIILVHRRMGESTFQLWEGEWMRERE